MPAGTEPDGPPVNPAEPAPSAPSAATAGASDPLAGDGVLRPADQELLARAIKAGMSPDAPELPAVVRSIAFVVVLAALLMAGYQGLQRWRPAQPLTLTADQAASSRQMTLGSANHPVTWRASSVYAAGMQVTGPETTTIEIDLPVPASACAQVAAALGPSVRCDPSLPQGAAVSLTSPLSLVWATPVATLLLPPSAGGAQHVSPVLGVTVQAPVAATSPASPTTATTSPGPAAATSPTSTTTTGPSSTTAAAGSVVTLAADQGMDQQRWCYEGPTSANHLRLQRGANQSVHDFTGNEQVACGAGLRLIVGTASGGTQPPAVTLQSVASLRLEATSTEVDAQSVVGQLHLGSSGSPVLGTPTEVIVRSHPAAPIKVTLFVQADRSSLTVTAKAATSVMTDTGNLVTSFWDRHQDIALPILLALVGGVIPILLSTMQGMMSLHRRRHTPGLRGR